MTDNEKELEKLTGVVERIVYQNKENGYSVVEIEVGEAEYETVFGTLPYIAEGEVIAAYGSYVNSPKYGRQFKDSYIGLLRLPNEWMDKVSLDDDGHLSVNSTMETEIFGYLRWFSTYVEKLEFY